MGRKELPRGIRNNNPGNIIKNNYKWQGASKEQHDPRFVTFETMAHGYRALFILLRTYIRKHHLNTIPAIIRRYAPYKENNTDAYIRGVLNQIKGTETTEIRHTDKQQMQAIAKAITLMENGVYEYDKEMEDGWNLYMYDTIV